MQAALSISLALAVAVATAVFEVGLGCCKAGDGDAVGGAGNVVFKTLRIRCIAAGRGAERRGRCALWGCRR